MTNALAHTNDAASVIEQVIAAGDLERLTPEQRTTYYVRVCESVGLNPYTQPFEYIKLQGKLTLYAKKTATDQLRKIHGVSVRIVSQERMDDVLVVTAEATDKAGRVDTEIGAVSVGNLKGDNLANALMKAITKAKRRVTLSICGLGMLDETEIETIPSAQPTPQYNAEVRNQPQAVQRPAFVGLVESEPAPWDPERYQPEPDNDTGEIDADPAVVERLLIALADITDRRDLGEIKRDIRAYGLEDHEVLRRAYKSAFDRLTAE